MFQQLLQEDFRMLQVVSTGAYYPPVDTTWKILTTGASQLTVGAFCSEEIKAGLQYSEAILIHFMSNV